MEALTLLTQEIKELRGDLEAAKEERETLSASDKEERETLVTRMEKIEVDLGSLKETKKETERLYLPGLEVGINGDPKKWSWGRAMKVIGGLANTPSMQKACGLEINVFEDMAKAMDEMTNQTKAAISAATDAEGGFLIPMEVQRELIPLLRDQSIAYQLGVRRLDGLVGDIQWIKNKGGISIAYVDTEKEELATESRPTFSSGTMRPHVAVGAVPLTWSMMIQPAIVLDTWVPQELSAEMALFEDVKYFFGSGAGKEPQGLNTLDGIGSYDWSTTPLSGGGVGVAFGHGTNAQNVSRQLRRMIKKVAKAKALAGARSLGWAGSTDAIFSISDTVDKDAKPIFIRVDEPFMDRIYGYLARFREDSPFDDASDTDETLFFGNYAQSIIGHWGTLAFSATDTHGNDFLKLRKLIRAVFAHDVFFMQAGAFCKALNLDTTSTQ